MSARYDYGILTPIEPHASCKIRTKVLNYFEGIKFKKNNLVFF